MTQEPERLPHGFRERLDELFSNLRQGVLYLRRLIVHNLTVGELFTDTISEQNSGSGVTVDELINLKDGIISTVSGDLSLYPAGKVKVISTDEVWLYCNSPILRGATGGPVLEFRDKNDLKLWAITPGADTLTLSKWDGEAWQAVFALSSASLAVDTIAEKTAAAGVTVDGVLLKDSEVTTDFIHEKTPGAGITVDGLLIKDNFMEVEEIPTPANPALNNLRLFARASGDDILLMARSSQGAEAVLATLDDTAGAHTNTLGLNWIE